MNYKFQTAAHGLWEILDIDASDHDDSPNPNDQTMDDFSSYPSKMSYVYPDGTLWEPFVNEDGELEN